VFGFSFSELVVVAVVALVIFGPKDLPNLLRRLGQYAGKLRRAAADLRVQSGIDDALRSEGLADDLAEIRKLARGELDAVQRAARIENEVQTRVAADPYGQSGDFYVIRDREYPREGADAYHALPDNAVVYIESMPMSILARDPLYVLGDEKGELPPEPPPPEAPAPGPVHTIIGGVGLATEPAADSVTSTERS
jgi:sec-independent protein translocase protein TatB